MICIRAVEAKIFFCFKKKLSGMNNLIKFEEKKIYSIFEGWINYAELYFIMPCWRVLLGRRAGLRVCFPLLSIERKKKCLFLYFVGAFSSSLRMMKFLIGMDLSCVQRDGNCK